MYSYTAVLAGGVLLGMIVTARRARPRSWLDGWLWGMAAAIVGGRLGFIWREWAYFQERPSDLTQLWQGGFWYHTALLGGLLGVWAWARWQKRPLLPLLDLFAPGIGLLIVAGWIACWLEGCAYGAETTLAWWSADLPDHFGVFAVRFQTQWLGALGSLLPLAGVLAWRRPLPPGARFGWLLLGVSLTRVAVSLLRGDPMILWGPLRLDTWLDGATAVAGLIFVMRNQVMRNGVMRDKSEDKEAA